MYTANTLWAIAKGLMKKYKVKSYTELVPSLKPERHDDRTGKEIEQDVIAELERLAKRGEAGK